VPAADLIGQLGDPAYPRQANALYWEFEEVGINRQLGYLSPANLIEKYPIFWNSVSMYLQEGLNGPSVVVRLSSRRVDVPRIRVESVTLVSSRRQRSWGVIAFQLPS
jgi:hypothetical protein